MLIPETEGTMMVMLLLLAMDGSNEDLQGEIEGLRGEVARLKAELTNRLDLMEMAIGILLHEQDVSPDSVGDVAELADRFNAASQATMPASYQAQGKQS